MTARALVAALCAALTASGCYKTTVRSGLPPADPPERYEEYWHSGWLLGAIEASGPHDLSSICPDGWAQIDTKTDASQGLATLLTLGIYAPQTVTVVCAQKGASTSAAPPAPKGF